ncbi:hypothetical protein CDAR_561761 [Caerostris darwini]|uniref:Uncharacterized protein n=1 Tax=Caerostris darwini TaxID=1538125 RepID=A0AAV4QRG2_9ARAC|nr:hypothetical protein CDAR_561761 [Caerostris darwini]
MSDTHSIANVGCVKNGYRCFYLTSECRATPIFPQSFTRTYVSPNHVAETTSSIRLRPPTLVDMFSQKKGIDTQNSQELRVMYTQLFCPCICWEGEINPSSY